MPSDIITQKTKKLVEAGRRHLDEAEADESPDLAWLAASTGRARLKQGATAEDVVAFAVRTLEQYDHSHRGLLALIRDADNRYSTAAKYFRMSVDAKIPFTDPAFRKYRGYIVNYDVVAETIDEALTFVARMEEPSVQGNLIVGEHQILADRSEDPKGVYKRTWRHYYERED